MRLGTARAAVDSAAASFPRQFALEVEEFLQRQPRQLPSKYLYDPLGSALFEAICRLPWYPLTRAEARLIEAHAVEVFSELGPVSTIVELGSGSGEKIAALIEAGAPDGSPLEVHLIDVSASALNIAVQMLARFPNVQVVPHETAYEQGLEELGALRPNEGRTLALFLGSNIGNFDPPGRDALLEAIRAALRPGDAFLLGADLIKPKGDLLLAYDDPLGVTAAFNRNLLVRMNRELGASFSVGDFAHRAVWNEPLSRVEMHLVSLRSQDIAIPVARLRFQMANGDYIWTESSYKYTPHDLAHALQESGFRVTREWIDQASRFALTLVEVA